MRHGALKRFLRERGMHDLYVVSWVRPLVSRAVATASRLVRDNEANGRAVVPRIQEATTFELTSIVADKMPQYVAVPPGTRTLGTSVEPVSIHFMRSDAVLRRSARSKTFCAP